MRNIIGYIAKRFYQKKYVQLQERLLYEYNLVKYDDVVNFDTLTNLLISGEDHRFYYHIGFDIIAIIRAIRNRILYNKVEGASTIEQQLVRVLTNDFERTLKRKIQEIILATTINSIIPKNVVPIIYLNVAYYGTGMNGLTQAIAALGIKEQKNLPLENAAELVSRIKYPQPRIPTKIRLLQIELRKKHLILLYNKHLKKKYFKIYG